MNERDKEQEIGVEQILKEKKLTLENPTGFGKTTIALKAIKKILFDNCYYSVTVIVPSTDLVGRWREAIEETLPHYEDCFRVVTIQNLAYHKESINCNIVVLDEVHEMYTEDRLSLILNFNCEYLIALSATPYDKHNRHIKFFEICPIKFRVTEEKAIAMNALAEYKEFNLKIELDEEERQIYNSINSKLSELSYKLGGGASAFEQARSIIMNPRRFDGFLVGYARQYLHKVRQRKTFLYNHKSKIVTSKLIKNVFENKKIIFFCQTIDFAINLAEELEIEAYHSKLGVKERRRILNEFKEISNKSISAPIALDRGIDVPDINISVITSGSSSKTQQTQRSGRAKRFQFGEEKIIINLYINDTKDYDWLRQRQKDNRRIMWISDVKQINLSNTII